MSTQNTETEAIPQGDGADRPFRVGRIVQLSNDSRPIPLSGRVMVHSEKSGPAFLPMSVAEQLGASVASRTAKTVGELLNALGIPRECFLDVMPAWSRLLKIQDITILRMDDGTVYRAYPRLRWEFAEMREAVVLALCHLEERDQRMVWANADALLRGYAMTLAHGSESKLANPRDLTDDDMERIAGNAKRYRDFAEGRS